MANWTRRSFLGSVSGMAAASLGANAEGMPPRPQISTTSRSVKIKITDLKCAIIGRNPVVRVAGN